MSIPFVQCSPALLTQWENINTQSYNFIPNIWCSKFWTLKISSSSGLSLAKQLRIVDLPAFWSPNTPITTKSVLSVKKSDIPSQKMWFSSTNLSGCFSLGTFSALQESRRMTGLLTAGDSDLLPSSLCLRMMFAMSGLSGPFLLGETSLFTRARTSFLLK